MFQKCIQDSELYICLGFINSYGTKYFQYEEANYDAPIIARLKKEGALILGKTNLNEFMLGNSGSNP